MRNVVDALVGLAVLAFLLALGFRFFSPNMGFAVSNSFVTPLFLWRGALGLLTLAAVLVLRQIREQIMAASPALNAHNAAPAAGSRSV